MELGKMCLQLHVYNMCMVPLYVCMYVHVCVILLCSVL